VRGLWLCCLLGCVLACGAAQAGELRDVGSGFAGYRIFVPDRQGGTAAPLVVVLHGCDQDADTTARATGWDRVAERHGFFVLYPNQSRERNPLGCWDWFLPADQQAGLGEPAEIMAAIDQVVSRHPINQARIYVTGLSAGGAMAAVLMSCYPDRFAAGAIHSGIAYGLATGVSSAFALMRKGPQSLTRDGGPCDPSAFHGGVLVVQGLADKVVAPANAEAVFRQFTAGRRTISHVAYTPEDGQSRAFRETDDWSGGKLVGRLVLVEGMAHCWGGGGDDFPCNDARSPDATAMDWAFFARFTATQEVAAR
jgi:poly(hydroxyalkanoate) depolymerase family esterase